MYAYCVLACAGVASVPMWILVSFFCLLAWKVGGFFLNMSLCREDIACLTFACPLRRLCLLPFPSLVVLHCCWSPRHHHPFLFFLKECSVVCINNITWLGNLHTYLSKMAFGLWKKSRFLVEGLVRVSGTCLYLLFFCG